MFINSPEAESGVYEMQEKKKSLNINPSLPDPPSHFLHLSNINDANDESRRININNIDSKCTLASSTRRSLIR